MDLMDVEDLSRGCEGKNCGLAPGFLEDCTNQACYWEEPMFGLIELVCVTVVYIPLMIFGLLGNILTILVVWLRPHMRSSTYLYLSSMAISDLLILLLLPLDLYKLWRPRPWPLGDLACKLTMFLSECCTFCTILHITFLSLERYLAVCWPITAKTVVTRRRTRAIIGCLWLGAAVSAAPVLVMVGVEDVGGEELGFGLWREDGGWSGREGEHGGLMTGGGERGGEHMALLDPGLEGTMFGEEEPKTWNEEFGDFKWFEKKGKHKAKEVDKRRLDKSDEKVTDEEGREEEGKMEFEGEQQNKKKEDEGGGRQGGRGGEIDRRECRCTHYAISSGLLSAMMILSNLYFLVPLCILGLVYSLIGRTLWLRPKSSRRDQSHRNTVKMLGVIVLAFVLCWLPFHVGRTIFSLSLGSGAERQETYPDANSNLDIDTLADSFDSRDIDVHSVSKPFIHSESVGHTPAGTDDRNVCAEAGERINTQNNNMAADKFISQDSEQAELKDINTDTSTQNLQPEANKPMGAHNNSAHVNTRQGRLSDSTNTTTPTAGPSTYTAAPADLYTDKTHDYTHFNDTHAYPDTHVYFLYYLSQYFNLVSSVLFYLSAAVNPLLYNLMSARYRLAVLSLMHKHSHTQAHRLRTLTARHSTTTL